MSGQVSGPFMLIDADLWAYMENKMEQRDRALDRTDDDINRVGAEAFMQVFDPYRSDEWGHVSYCIGVAIDARKKAVR